MEDSKEYGLSQAVSRLEKLASQLEPVNDTKEEVEDDEESLLTNPTNANLPRNKASLTITDNRTGKLVEVPINKDTIKANELQTHFGLRSYDPGYINTACATSKISYIDGDKGILQYRGYPIEELAEKSTFIEVAYLLINGDLPSKKQLDTWNKKVMTHTFIHENLAELMKTFRYDAHPMGMLISSVAALSTFYPEANAALSGQDIYQNPSLRNKQIYRIIGKLPTIAACAYRHRIGRPYNHPNPNLNYTENFLYMLDSLNQPNYKPHPKLARALDILFMLHADHELNCSTAAMRHVTSALTDPYCSVAASAAALFGPLHGGACEAVLRMLENIGNVDNIPAFIAAVKNKKKKLMGFGHRIYKNYDPRAKIIRKIAYEVFEVVGKEPLVEVAIELENQALNDEYFVSRKLYPNVDFYTGLIYKAMGFPTDMFPVLFTIPRTVGWLAHWLELLNDPENKIVRPRQVYVGELNRHYVPLGDKDRGDSKFPTMEIYSTIYNKRTNTKEAKEDGDSA